MVNLKNINTYHDLYNAINTNDRIDFNEFQEAACRIAKIFNHPKREKIFSFAYQSVYTPGDYHDTLNKLEELVTSLFSDELDNHPTI